MRGRLTRHGRVVDDGSMNVKTCLGAVVGLIGAATIAIGPAPAAAIDFVVTTTADSIDGADGLLSLREAFALASSTAGDDIITLNAASTYQLVNCLPGELPDLGVDSLTVQGNGSTIEQTCVDKRIISKTQATGTITLNNLTLMGGTNSGAIVHGAAVLSAGHLVLDHTTVSDVANNIAGTVVEFINTPALYDVELLSSLIVNSSGTAIKNQGIGGGLHVVTSTIDNNSGSGISFTDGSPVVIENSFVTHNGLYGVRTTGQGTATLTISASSVSDNGNTGVACGACSTVAVTDSSLILGNGTAGLGGGGGGIAVTTDQDAAPDVATVTVSDSSIGSNHADHDGAGISVNWIEAHDATAQVQTNVTRSNVSGNVTDCALCAGGGISVLVGSVLVTDSTVSGNTATGAGGGIRVDRRNGDLLAAPTTFWLANSLVIGNASLGDGGGISAHASNVAISKSEIGTNTAANGAGLSTGGIFITGRVESGNVSIRESTIHGNAATGLGGGLQMSFPDGSHAVVENSTIHANTAAVGGAIAAGLTEPLTIRFATITANSAPIGANLAVSSFSTIGTSVVAEPAGGGTNCAALPGFALNLSSAGYSWFDAASCLTVVTDVVAPGGGALLGPLAANGGPTTTRLPAATSPVAGIVPLAACSLPTDQRALARPAGTACDAGAVEIVENAAHDIVGTSRADEF